MAAATGDEDDEDEEEEEASPSKTGAAAKPQSLADLMPKVDIRCVCVCACVCAYICAHILHVHLGLFANSDLSS